MNRVILITAIAALLASIASAGPTATYIGQGKTGIVNISGIGNVYTGEMKYLADDIVGLPDGQFITFCVEVDEHVSNNITYDAIINSEAVQGGLGGPSPDPLSNSTAWLYNYYLDNVLAVSTNSIARDYQLAVWCLEEEISYNDSAMTTGAKNLYNSAVGHIDWQNNSIVILNLYGLGTYGTECPVYKQDCLARIPMVPAPPALILGVIGCSLTGYLKKKKQL